MIEKLSELIGSKICEDYTPTCDEYSPHTCKNCYANNCKIGELAEHLLTNNVFVSPCETVWFIVDKNTKYAMAMPRQTDELPLYMLKDLNKYGYYKTKEEAEKHL